jgi:hypothetical protein
MNGRPSIEEPMVEDDAASCMMEAVSESTTIITRDGEYSTMCRLTELKVLQIRLLTPRNVCRVDQERLVFGHSEYGVSLKKSAAGCRLLYPVTSLFFPVPRFEFTGYSERCVPILLKFRGQIDGGDEKDLELEVATFTYDMI